MTAKYYAILTKQGAAKLANATALGTTLHLTQMAIGDANGVLPAPDASQTKLINQKRIAPLNSLSIDPDNSSQIIAEQVIPENEGGYWIRELGLYDDEGVLIAVANCPETYKPQMQEGSGRTQTVRMVLIVSSTAAVTLKIDPSVVLATRKYVDDKAIEVRAYVDGKAAEDRAYTDDKAAEGKAYTDNKATEGRAYADGLLNTHIAAANPHTQYLQINQNLKEIADAGSAAVADALKNLGLGEAAKRAVGNGAGQLPDMSFFTLVGGLAGYIKLPGGFIYQWGQAITGNGAASITFPLKFPGGCVGVNVTGTSARGSDDAAIVNVIAGEVNESGFGVNGFFARPAGTVLPQGIAFIWTAWGY